LFAVEPPLSEKFDGFQDEKILFILGKIYSHENCKSMVE